MLRYSGQAARGYSLTAERAVILRRHLDCDAFKLIACCSSGTKYEHYLDTLAEIEDHSGRLLVDRMVDAGYPIRRLDDELIHIMSTALFNGMFETIRHDMPREKAMVYMDDLRNFYSAGWFRLLGIPFE